MYDFANILFSGPCNLRCPDCIGHKQNLRSMPENLTRFPLDGLEAFIEELRRHEVRRISFSGVNTDPQLYQHEAQLLSLLRREVPQVNISLHTNGLLALKKIETFNLYDRACISFPSFRPEVYRAMTGASRLLDLAAIVEAAEIPLKVSTLLTEENVGEVPSLIERCRELGIARMVLRKLYGETRQWNMFPDLRPARYFGGNPVYEIDGMEVTLWDFSTSCVRCLNLFSDGSISPEYQLAGRKEG